MELSQLEWCKSSGEEPGWLSQVIEHGFSIHFLDGNRDNIDGSNLVLLYRKDAAKIPETSQRRFNKSQRSYELRSSTTMKWSEIAEDIKATPANAVTMAKLYSKTHNLPWPITK